MAVNMTEKEKKKMAVNMTEKEKEKASYLLCGCGCKPSCIHLSRICSGAASLHLCRIAGRSPKNPAVLLWLGALLPPYPS
jgi:late competence protein required for DNA uptake (superfamily II DNA/RNA helicase)